MAGSADRRKKTKSSTIEILATTLWSTDSGVKSYERNVGRQFPTDKKRYPRKHKIHKPAAWLIKKVEIKSRKISKAEIRKIIGGIFKTKRTKAIIL